MIKTKRVKIEFEVELPDVDHTDTQLEEWLRFEFRDNGCMKQANPFNGNEPDPIFGTFMWDYI